MNDKELILYHLVMREKIYAFEQRATEGPKCYSIKGLIPKRISKDILMEPAFNMSVYPSIWCKEEDVKEAVRLLHAFALESAKGDWIRADETLRTVIDMNLETLVLRDDTVPVQPFQGEIKL